MLECVPHSKSEEIANNLAFKTMKDKSPIWGGDVTQYSPRMPEALAWVLNTA